MDNLQVYHGSYYRMTDLMKYNKYFFKGFNWDSKKLCMVEGVDYLCTDEKYHSPRNCFLSIVWCENNVPNPDKDWYCYW